MNSANTGKRSQREIFTDFLNALTAFNMHITEYLIKDLFNLLSQSLMVLDNAFIRRYRNGSYVAVIHSCIRSVFCDKEYHIPVSILYPISGKSEDAMRIFLIVSKNSTINKQCKYINQETNEIIIENLSAWSFRDGLIPVISILQNYFSAICPLYEINASDVVIPVTELQFFERLGSGASACVFRGMYNGQQVALKQMYKIPSPSEYRFLLREFQTQMRFKHDCILDIIGHSESKEGFPILVMELAGASLEDLIIKKKKKLSNEVKKKYILDIARALEYLHSYNIVHRDVKLANIMLKDDIAKLADFGYAREIENNKSIQVSFCGSPAMIAPEIIDNAKCSTKVDVYSFGCVLYEIILEKHCYFDSNMKAMTLLRHVMDGMRPTLQPGMPLEPVLLMKRCWLEDKQRPPMKEIVQIVSGWNTEKWNEDLFQPMEEEENGGGN